ncbi:putative lipopolysaccharide heptosyltransferase III [Pantoea sp. Aalb]|uniref:putative lipopolysaccharide heptosyltransferase III n=1 Tax=Pantoea sp. Aalb TaxID=2576762 RepID=UPI00132B2884|nr:putative lipopolysaccharide heptosyltransferase III [Pantoea sp. Aalb]MXP67939.1 putative lipopolysaccharide heptosyltransferase III [Pantoea sp. Aalb]
MTSQIPTKFIPKNILLIKLRHHGDILLITPTINALRQHYPQANIDVLLYKETRPILESHPAISQLLMIDRNWKNESCWQKICHEAELVSTVRAYHYDLVINLADQWRSAVITGLSGAMVRIGFAFKKRDNMLWRWCHNQLVTTDKHHQLHTVEQNMSALTPLGFSIKNAKTSMHFSMADRQKVKSILELQQIKNSFIVVQPTSRWLFKCWDDEKFAQLIDILSNDGYTIMLTSSSEKKEMAMVAKIKSLCHSQNIISLAGQLSLPQLAALIDFSQLFIGVDSAPMHIAAALGTPCLALFGPTKLQQWWPWGDNNKIIWAGHYAPLPLPDSIDTKTNQRYLSSIPVVDVVNAARSFLHE